MRAFGDVRSACALIALLLAAACGGGDPGSGGEGEVPETPSDTARVAGVVTVNGESNVGRVGITMVTEESASGTPAPDAEAEPIPTEADGTFAFEALEPGTYVVIASSVAYDFSIGAIDYDEPCSASGFEVLNAQNTDGAEGILLLAQNEETPVELAAGDDLTIDVAFECVA